MRGSRCQHAHKHSRSSKVARRLFSYILCSSDIANKLLAILTSFFLKNQRVSIQFLERAASSFSDQGLINLRRFVRTAVPPLATGEFSPHSNHIYPLIVHSVSLKPDGNTINLVGNIIHSCWGNHGHHKPTPVTDDVCHLPHGHVSSQDIRHIRTEVSLRWMEMSLGNHSKCKRTARSTDEKNTEPTQRKCRSRL